MIENRYLNREWAETMSLYSGLLDDDERTPFIKELATIDILLASECRTNIFAEDKELDSFLTEIAVMQSSHFEKPTFSANGLLALAELGQFNHISNIFKSIKGHSNSTLYHRVLTIFLRNGNDLQIFELLKILAESNVELLSKSLDIVQDLSLPGFSEPQRGKVLLELLVTPRNALLENKIISLFQMINKISDPRLILYSLIEGKQIKYADRLSRMIPIIADGELLKYFNRYVSSKESSGTLKIFVEIIDRVHVDFDRAIIRINLSKSLNPIIKNLSLLTGEDGEIGKELALKICRENIDIGNRSSIEFALRIMNDYQLEESITKEDLVHALLRDPKFQRVELAYNIVKEHHLSGVFSYRKIYNLLVGHYDYHSLALARLLVLEEFPKSEQIDLLNHLSCLALKDGKIQKLTKQILFEDVPILLGSRTYDTKFEYTGFIVGKNKGNYFIQFSTSHGLLRVSKSNVELKVSSIVKFTFTEILPNIQQSSIRVVRSTPIINVIGRYWYEEFYIGQIFSFKVTSYEGKKALMSIVEKGVTFILPIHQIGLFFVKDIKSTILKSIAYDVQITHFDKVHRFIYCSIKSLLITSDYNGQNKPNIENKLQSLVEKYSKGNSNLISASTNGTHSSKER